MKENERNQSLCRQKETSRPFGRTYPDEKVKYEIVEELGLLDRVMQDGWKSLTSKETGKIGGLITKKKRQTGNNKK